MLYFTTEEVSDVKHEVRRQRRRGRPQARRSTLRNGVKSCSMRPNESSSAEYAIRRSRRSRRKPDMRERRSTPRSPTAGNWRSALGRRHTDRLLAAAEVVAGQAKSMRQLIGGVIDVVCEFVETARICIPSIMQMMVVGSAEHPQRPLFSEIADWASGVLDAAMRQVGVDPAAARTWAAAIAGATLLAAEDWNVRRDRSRTELVERDHRPGVAGAPRPSVQNGVAVGPVLAPG